ncbi:MAG TPA: lyase family protein [Gaiellaceae bacterium]
MDYGGKKVSLSTRHLYGPETQRALEVFGGSPPLSSRPELVRALAQVKAAAAEANAVAGVLDPAIAGAIVEAAEEVAAGQWDDQFPLALVHGGGGTATNLAVDEVLAARASELAGEAVHPLDHVNRSQSTNDVYPTALAVAAIDGSRAALAGLEFVAAALDDLAAAAGDLQRLGRTCLRDALPLPVASYHGAQARAVRRGAAQLERAVAGLYEVPLGGTAVGTGFGAPAGYRERAVERLAERTGVPLRPAEDSFDALAHLDPLLGVATAAAGAAVTLGKIAADLRLLGSGPIGGIGEVRLPAVQRGSSMMPGKINPVVPEHVIQASFEIRGAAHVVELAVAAGELDVNVMETVIARYLLEALARLGSAAETFAAHCLRGLEWDVEVVERHLAGSLESAVELAAERGHQTVDPPLYDR